MRVAVHPADMGGCGFYRMREPARVAALEGVETEVRTSIASGLIEANDGSVRKRYLTEEEESFDVYVFQRPAREGLLPWLPHLQGMGKAIVIDIDDDMTCLHPQHPLLSGPREHDASWRSIRRACMSADLVTVSSEALAERYAPHGRVKVVPNCVPEALLDMPRESDGRTIGWGGYPPMHPGDLEVTRGGVADALEGTDWRFLHIGPKTHPGPGVPEGRSVVERMHLPRAESTSGLTIQEYHEAIGRLDIGIVPLDDTKFNAAKSYLKGIEYAARGVPFVASRAREYERLHAREGLGTLVAPKARKWSAALSRLMEDSGLRAEEAERGLRVVRERHTLEGQAWRWVDAWEQAIANTSARTLVPA